MKEQSESGPRSISDGDERQAGQAMRCDVMIVMRCDASNVATRTQFVTSTNGYRSVASSATTNNKHKSQNSTINKIAEYRCNFCYKFRNDDDENNNNGIRTRVHVKLRYVFLYAGRESVATILKRK